MRFPLVIPPLLLLILKWSSLDSDAVAFHNGSFVAVQSLDHIQFANISSIDGNFAPRNTRYRNSSTHDVKPLTLIDNVYNSEDIVPFHFIPDPQESRGKRQKRDSQEDELAQAKKNVTDLTNEIGNKKKITEKLKKKEEVASTVNEKYQTAKASVDTLEKLVAAWKEAEKARLEWESANRAVKKANLSLDQANENLKAANETLEAAVKELERVEGEPELLKKLTAEFHRLDPIYKALQTAVNNWETELPLLQQAVTDAQSYVTQVESEVARAGCVGKKTEDECSALFKSLDQFRTTRDNAQAAFDAAEADNIKKTEELAQCEPNWKDLKEKIEELNTDVAEPRHGTNLLKAQSDVNSATSKQESLLEKFKNALKTRDEAAETTRLAKESYEKKESNVPADGADVSRAYEAAKLELGTVNTIKNNVDGEVNNLKSQLKEKNIELEQANAKFVEEKLDTQEIPEDVMLDKDQDAEFIDEDSQDTQYDRTAPTQVNKTGADLLNEHAKDKISVDDALKMAKWAFIAVHQKLNLKFLPLMQLAAAARDVFMKEKPLVECGLPVTIYGDIHGQVGDAVRLINTVTYDPSSPNSRVLDLNKQHFVFCGDYVDRGNRQVETLMLLFSLKVAYPNNVHILRGNHETRDINYKYGFLVELTTRYGKDEGTKLYEVFNEVFDHLPLACHIGGKILCVHGGISPHLHKLEDINKIPKPLSIITDSPLAEDLLWADPLNGFSGTKPNEGRRISIHFGEDALDEKLKELEVITMFRGHQVPGDGFAWFGLKKKLCTVFTATGASKGNFSAAVKINEKGEMKMCIMFKGCLFPGLTAEESSSKSSKFHNMAHELNNEKDNDYAVFKEEEQPGLFDMDQTTFV